MPMASEEMRKRWGGYMGVGEDKAMQFLEAHGFRLLPDWTWVAPAGHQPTDDEFEAIQFLIEEWDFGGLA